MLPLLPLRLSFRAESAGQLPEFAGAVWRSGMGLHLRQALCFTGLPACARCPSRRGCAYPAIMEPAPAQSATLISRYRSAPPPYVLSAPTGGAVSVGSTVDLDVILIGKGDVHAAPVLRALERAGAAGLGRQGQRIRLVLESIQHLASGAAPGVLERHRALPFAQPLAVPPPPAAVRLILEQPLRLREQESYLRPQAFTLRALFKSLLLRASNLADAYGDGPLGLDHQALLEHAAGFGLGEPQLSWHHQRRYSARQELEVETSGITGSFELHGNLAPLWPLLWIGQWLHVGKGTVMGLGRYRLQVLPE